MNSVLSLSSELMSLIWCILIWVSIALYLCSAWFDLMCPMWVAAFSMQCSSSLISAWLFIDFPSSNTIVTSTVDLFVYDNFLLCPSTAVVSRSLSIAGNVL